MPEFQEGGSYLEAEVVRVLQGRLGAKALASLKETKEDNIQPHFKL